MKPERWRKIDELFQSALDCEPERRSAFLDASCSGDNLLREEVESLLALSQNRRFTEAPAFQDSVRLLEESRSQGGT